MKSFKKVFSIILVICLIFLNLSTIYANTQDIPEIIVGLLKYSKVFELDLSVKGELLVSDDENFYNTNFKNISFKIKSISSYIIKEDKTNMPSFINNDNNKFILKDGDFYYAYGLFSNEAQAKDFYTKNNLKGYIKKENLIGLFIDNKLVMACKNSLFIKSSDGFITVGKDKYRNFTEITYRNNGLYTLNHISVEEYLYSVVPSEMPPSWHKEALKAQAVAARNYAIANRGTHSFEGFDVCDSIHCQVYSGVSKEQDSTNVAVDETKGIMAYFNGESINAVFSSSSGGYTDNSENVWGNKIPYLRAVEDKYEEGYKTWTRTFTFDELSNLAGIGNISEIIVQNSTQTGRVLSIKLIGDKGEKSLEKEEVRTFFSKTNDGSLLRKNFIVSNNSKSIQTPILVNSKLTTLNNANNNELYMIKEKSEITKINNNIYAIDKNNKISNINSPYIIDKNNKITNIKDNTEVKQPETTQTSPNDIIETAYATSLKRSNSQSITFVGKGWGHGVGMSQYGANSLAKKGYKFNDILKYYYTGIEVR